MFALPAILNQGTINYQLHWDNIVLWLKGDPLTTGDLTVRDFSKFNNSVTAPSLTTYPKYGTHSINCIGTSYVRWANCDTSFGSGDFTIEGWFYFASLSTTAPHHYFFDSRTGSTSGFIWDALNGGRLYCNGSTYTVYVNPSMYSWTHLAISKVGTTLRAFTNGSLTSTATGVGSISGSSGGSIGGDYLGSSSTRSDYYVDSFRITKGIGRYTVNFNPETNTFLAY